MRRFIPETAILVPEHATKVFSGIIYEVYQWEQKQFDGSFETWEMLKRPDSVNIIGVHKGRIVLSYEEQPHVGRFTALPAGMHDHPDEDELEAAKREMREETGYVFKNWKLIHARQASQKIEQILYTFLATDVEDIVPQQLDVGEKIEPVLMSFKELKAMREDAQLRFYPSYIFDKVDSLEELLPMPSLFDYGNND